MVWGIGREKAQKSARIVLGEGSRRGAGRHCWLASGAKLVQGIHC
jgi:hypothetical protein